LTEQRLRRYVVQRTVFRIVAQPTIRFLGLTSRMSVLSEIRSLPEAIRVLTVAVRAHTEATLAAGPGEDRLDALERSRATWEAEAEGMILKADSRYKAAAASEARSRLMEKNAEKLADPFAEESEDRPEGIPPEYARIGTGEALQPVHEDVGVLSQKELALRMKFS